MSVSCTATDPREIVNTMLQRQVELLVGELHGNVVHGQGHFLAMTNDEFPNDE